MLFPSKVIIRLFVNIMREIKRERERGRGRERERGKEREKERELIDEF